MEWFYTSGGNVSQINQNMLSQNNHPFFTLTANNITNKSQFNNKTEANHRKSAISVLTKLKFKRGKINIKKTQSPAKKTQSPAKKTFKIT